MTAIYDTMQFVRLRRRHDLRGPGGVGGRGPARRRARRGSGRCCRTPGSLLHQPSAEGRGTLPDLALQAKEVARVRAEMEQILAEHTGQTAASRSARTPTAT